MTVSYKAGAGTYTLGVTANPTYPAGGAANDLCIMTIAAARTTSSGPAITPNTPAGWTRIGEVTYWGSGAWKYYRIGNFSGSAGAISFSGTAPDVASANIITYTCGGSETWHMPDGIQTWHARGHDTSNDYVCYCQGTYNGDTGNGIIRLAPGDMLLSDTVHWNGTFGIYNAGYSMGSGVTSSDSFLITQAHQLPPEIGSLISMHARALTTVPNTSAPVTTYQTWGNTYCASMWSRLTTRERTSADTGTVIDLQSASGLTGADTGTATEAETVRTSVTVPYPRRWSDGEVPSGIDRNTGAESNPVTSLVANWQAPLLWLLGYTRPFFSGSSQDTTSWTQNVPFSIPINTEIAKMNGMVHATNDTKIYVPEDGFYDISANMSWDSNGSAGVAGKNHALILRNGVDIWATGTTEQMHVESDLVSGGFAFRVYMRAGEYLELLGLTTSATGTIKNWVGIGYDPQISVWWSSR